jgi:hypothetical protein
VVALKFTVYGETVFNIVPVDNRVTLKIRASFLIHNRAVIKGRFRNPVLVRSGQDIGIYPLAGSFARPAAYTTHRVMQNAYGIGMPGKLSG